MNILTDTLPCSVIINGTEYPIKTDFRAWMRFAISLSENSHIAESVYDIVPNAVENGENPDDIIIALSDFFIGNQKHSEGEEKKHSPRAYDFNQDSDLIYSAFLQDYGIDLSKANLHWWCFTALFSSLSENTRISEIMKYRTADIGKIKDKEQKKFYRNMQKRYSLKSVSSTNSAFNDFTNAFI